MTNLAKIFLILLIVLLASKALGTELSEVTNQLKRHQAKDAVPAAELAPVIISVSHFYGLDSRELAAVVLQESKGRAMAYNAVTHDHGIGQLNHRTATQYGLNRICLYDWRCNLAVTAKILAATRGETCRYNIGLYRDIDAKWAARCADYNSKLAQND